MRLGDLKARTLLFMVVGWASTILFIVGVTAIGRGNFHPALWYLMAGAGLTFVFFRKRMVAFAIIGLTFVLVNVGLTALFHPSMVGILLTVGSAGSLYLIIRWHTRKFPNLNPKDWQTTLFESKSEP
jgi:hypothetical protein